MKFIIRSKISDWKYSQKFFKNLTRKIVRVHFIFIKFSILKEGDKIFTLYEMSQNGKYFCLKLDFECKIWHLPHWKTAKLWNARSFWTPKYSVKRNMHINKQGKNNQWKLCEFERDNATRFSTAKKHVYNFVCLLWHSSICTKFFLFLYSLSSRVRVCVCLWVRFWISRRFSFNWTLLPILGRVMRYAISWKYATVYYWHRHTEWDRDLTIRIIFILFFHCTTAARSRCRTQCRIITTT